MVDPTIIDDNDPLVKYNPAALWTPGGVSVEYDVTTHSASTAGATATVTFNGTAVAVYGTIDISGDPNNPNDPLSTYSIDGSIVSSYTGVRSLSIIQYRQRFFQSPTLTDGVHTLVVNNTVNQGRLILDYMLVTTSTTLTSTSGTIPVSTATISVSGTPTSTSRGQNAASPGFVKVPIGALIGGAISLVVVVVLIVMLFFIWRLRRQSIDLRRSHELSPKNTTADASSSGLNDVTPFTQLPSHVSPAQNIVAEYPGQPLMSFNPTGRGYTVGGPTREKLGLHNTSQSSSSQSSGAGAANNVNERVQTGAVPYRSSPHESSGGLHPNHRPHGRGPVYPRAFYDQDAHVGSPPSYHIGSPMPINRGGGV